MAANPSPVVAIRERMYALSTLDGKVEAKDWYICGMLSTCLCSDCSSEKTGPFPGLAEFVDQVVPKVVREFPSVLSKFTRIMQKICI